jgi:hypothetical protein
LAQSTREDIVRTWRLPTVTTLLLVLLSSASTADEAVRPTFPLPAIDWSPRQYICYRNATPLQIDGSLGDPDWQRVPWTENFIDIQGAGHPEPRHLTRAKLLWDDTYLYVGAEMAEPHLSASLTERDAVIYHDNDFEIFIDPDGDTHQYYELEINALGTVWDLLLLKPYRDGGPAVDAWDIQGLRSAVKLFGTLNDPTQIDRGWSVEIAIPWKVLDDCAGKPSPPEPGNRWRINFSRVQWRYDVIDGRYVKQVDPETGNPLAEDNWVWSPQGLINMHYPEMWGLVQFSGRRAGAAPEPFRWRAEHFTAWHLRNFYYKQRSYQSLHGHYATRLDQLLPMPPISERSTRLLNLNLVGSKTGWEISCTVPNGRVMRISEDGLVR